MPVDVICKICGRGFKIKPSKVKAGITCSRECSAKDKSIRYSGKGNHQFGLVGKKNSSFKNGKRITSNGYVAILVPPDQKQRKTDNYVLEHRLIMEKKLGRKLLPEEDVHHKDEDRTNNDPDNLELYTRREHGFIHSKDKLLIHDSLNGRILKVIKNTK